MLKTVLLVFLGICLSVASFSAEAANRGRYYANPDVRFKSTVGTTIDTYANDYDQAYLYLKTVVNRDITMWSPGDTVDICDGNACLTITYVKVGQFAPTGPLKSDNGAAYKNHPALSTWDGGRGWSDSSIVRYVPGISRNSSYICEYIDYYSNGSYSFTSFAGCTMAP